MAVSTGPGTFTDIYIVATAYGFQQRVNYALTVAAVNVMAEAANTVSHTQRVAFAKQILSGGFPNAAYYGVLTNGTIAAEENSASAAQNIPDADIQFAVNSIFNALAGVSN